VRGFWAAVMAGSSEMRLMRVFLIVLTAVVAGCAQKSHQEPETSPQTDVSPPTVAEPGVLDEAKAIAIAREAVATNDTWVKRTTFDAMQDGKGWTVMVWREPRTPGGHRLVQIDNDGKVTAYIRGQPRNQDGARDVPPPPPRKARRERQPTLAPPPRAEQDASQQDG
jgi:hypothetical protein